MCVQYSHIPWVLDDKHQYLFSKVENFKKPKFLTDPYYNHYRGYVYLGWPYRSIVGHENLQHNSGLFKQ